VGEHEVMTVLGVGRVGLGECMEDPEGECLCGKTVLDTVRYEFEEGGGDERRSKIFHFEEEPDTDLSTLAKHPTEHDPDLFGEYTVELYDSFRPVWCWVVAVLVRC